MSRHKRKHQDNPKDSSDEGEVRRKRSHRTHKNSDEKCTKRKDDSDKKYIRQREDIDENHARRQEKNSDEKYTRRREKYSENYSKRKEKDSETCSRRSKRNSDKVHATRREASSDGVYEKEREKVSEGHYKKRRDKVSDEEYEGERDMVMLEEDYDKRREDSNMHHSRRRENRDENYTRRREVSSDENYTRRREVSSDENYIRRREVSSDVNYNRRREVSSDDNDNYGKSKEANSDENYTRHKEFVLREKENELLSEVKERAEPAESDMPTSKKKIETVNMKTGGAYIPPAKLKMMQEQIADKGSEQYQRLAWEALKKSLTGLTNKINVTNLADVVRELFKENLIRGRGVLARAIMQAQAASHTFTHVYAAFVAVINSKFPQIGELILKRLILQFKRGFRRNDKAAAVAATRFIAHLLNQHVAHEVLVLEILIVLLEKPTYDSVEIAVAMLKECGMRLTELSPKGMKGILDRLRSILHEKSLDARVQYMIEVMMAVNKDKFKGHEAIQKGLDLVEEDDRITHLITLPVDDSEKIDGEDILNVFKFDPDYLLHEEQYKDIAREILGEDKGDSSSGSDDDSEEESGTEDEDEKEKGDQMDIVDMTETNLVSLRRNIYLTIKSSLDFQECAHKLLKLELNPNQIQEMCYMILDCCSQERTYEKFFGLLAQRFCQLNNIYVEPFTQIFKNSYETIHRVETNKLRNVAKFFAHLLHTDAISWMVLANIKLNEDDTSSSSRIFIKILFQELSEYMGLPKLNDRIKDVTLQEAFEGLFPRDNPRNTRFAINFFTSIGLGGLTDELREHLKTVQKAQQAVEQLPANVSSAESESSSSSSESSSSSSSSSSESDESENSSPRKTKKKKNAERKEQLKENKSRNKDKDRNSNKHKIKHSSKREVEQSIKDKTSLSSKRKQASNLHEVIHKHQHKSSKNHESRHYNSHNIGSSSRHEPKNDRRHEHKSSNSREFEHSNKHERSISSKHSREKRKSRHENGYSS